MQANYSQRIESLCRVAAELSQLRSLDGIGEIVHDAVTKIIGADGAALFLASGPECYSSSRSPVALLPKSEAWTQDSAAPGWSMHHHCPAVIPDVAEDPRTPNSLYGSTAIRSIVTVPIENEPTTIACGAIESYWLEQHAASPDEVRLLQLLAGMAGMGLRAIRCQDELYERVRARTANLEALTRNLFLETHRRDWLAETAPVSGLTDDLTGLYNRASFFRFGEQALSRGRKQRRKVWVLYADIECLQKVNELEGHMAGDKLLQLAAQVLRDSLRKTDVIARVGGDEFCAVLSQIPKEGATWVSKLSAGLRMEQAKETDRPAPRLNIGLIQDDGLETTTLDQLLVRAERMMSMLKRWRQIKSIDQID